jgi:Protein of unknown function (DUF1549)/Protein of unknown function (DUF1553)
MASDRPAFRAAPKKRNPASVWTLLAVIAVLGAGSLAWALLRTPGADAEAVLAEIKAAALKKPTRKAADCPVLVEQAPIFLSAPVVKVAEIEASNEPPPSTAPVVAEIPAPVAPISVPSVEKPSAKKSIPSGVMDRIPVATKSANGRDPLALSLRIDQEIGKKLQERGISASPIASDVEFLRRVSLDLTGRIPTKERTLAFLNSADPAKRSKLIDELLASQHFGESFAIYWRDLIAKREGEYQFVANEPVFLDWMAKQYNRSPFWDKIVRALITAKGEEMAAGDTYLFLTHQDMQQPAPDKLAATVTTLFMGTQLQCAECHIHPVHKDWKPTDFWGIAAFFAHVRTDRQGDKKKVELGTARVTETGNAPGVGKMAGPKGKEIARNAPGTVKIPDPTEPTRSIGLGKAAVFGGPEAPAMEKTKYRPFLADWFTSPKNTYFGPAHVNRMWAYFFAAGFVNPIDDMRPDNPATHPDLLVALSDEFAKSEYDIKHLIRCICNSQAYQRTSRTTEDNADDATGFSHMPVRVLTPHQLFESLEVATGHDLTPDRPVRADKAKKKDGPQAKGREAAIQAFDTRDYDESPAEYTYGIPQLLRLMNRQLAKTCDETGEKAAAMSSPEVAIEHLYLTALSRRPTPSEIERMKSFASGEESPAKGYAGVFWALLNSAEFACNR